MARKSFFWLLVLLCTLAFASQSVWASAVNLTWDPNPETDLAGYTLYIGTQSRTAAPDTNTVPINDRTATGWTLALSPGVYYFALKAVDTSGNLSDFSNEVRAEVVSYEPPGKPGTPYLVQ